MPDDGAAVIGQAREDAVVDVLVLGAGPAALAIAAELCRRGVSVQGLAPTAPEAPWPNTYGIWAREVEDLGLAPLLEHRWQNSVAYFRDSALELHHDYGLFNRAALQQHWLKPCQTAGMIWVEGRATAIRHKPEASIVTTDVGQDLSARVVIDASGHHSPFVQRPAKADVAYQAAYGVVGRFSAPPVAPGQFVLMDYRSEHLTEAERREPPTFLYAMDLGNDVYFVEETSLAWHPAVTYECMADRLERRLAHQGIRILETQHVEHCLFPMNLPLPDLDQPLRAFGGAASLVHPASGYMVGALLRRGPALAEAIAAILKDPQASPAAIARQGWQTLWSPDLVRKHYLYQYGLEKLMGFSEAQLRQFFDTFFRLPQSSWTRFLTNELSLPELLQAMLMLFVQAPNPVRFGLTNVFTPEGRLLLRALTGA